MLNNCANPVCHTAFKLLDSGDFYALERHTANTEFFWLCPECASQFELHLDALGGIVLRLRGEHGHADLPLPEASLRLVAHAVQHRQYTPQGERLVLESSIPDTTRCSLRLHSF
jgi:hypothetical protein